VFLRQLRLVSDVFTTALAALVALLTAYPQSRISLEELGYISEFLELLQPCLSPAAAPT